MPILDNRPHCHARTDVAFDYYVEVTNLFPYLLNTKTLIPPTYKPGTNSFVLTNEYIICCLLWYKLCDGIIVATSKIDWLDASIKV